LIFNFPHRRGTGIARHLTHCSSDTVDLINQLCIYDPDHRISAAQALRHPYFNLNRSQENAQMQEQGVNQWEKEARIVKTSEDQYERSESTSSKSSVVEENKSPISNTHNPPTINQQQTFKPDFNRLIYPPSKAQSLIDTRIPGH